STAARSRCWRASISPASSSSSKCAAACLWSRRSRRPSRRGANTCAPARSISWATGSDLRHCATVKIINKKGLHARASAKIVEASARFQSHITVAKGVQAVDGRSIMGLMMLEASFGTQVEICAEGEDAQEALKALVALAEAKFGED